jgi:hypothetical protein
MEYTQILPKPIINIVMINDEGGFSLFQAHNNSEEKIQSQQPFKNSGA